jgi:phage virion morphogenesis protein
MAGAFLQVDIDDRAIAERFGELLRRGADLRPAFGEIGQHLDRSHRERWDREESPEGEKWAPLSPTTQAHKEKNADKILILNAHLRDTLAVQITAKSMQFGSNRVYAAVHQFGAAKGAFGRTARDAPIPWGDIPARRWLGLTGDDEAEILAILADHLAGPSR